MQDLIINEELKTLLPPLSEEEFAGLESSILKDGCLSDLIIWNEILVDGHNRYEICRKHKIPFGTKNVVLANLDEAKYWAWHNQDSRRNMTPYQRAELAMRLREPVAAKARERQRGGQGGVLLPQLVAEAKETRQELAEIAKMSHTTLERAEYIAEHADEETKGKLRRGEKGVTITGEYNRLKAENKAAENDAKTSKASTKSGSAKKPSGKSKETVTVKLKSSPKVNEKYCCDVKFEPDTDDEFFDWITDEERAELDELRKTCPNRLVPQIRNFTIQNIPEHKPDQLIDCLFSLFKVRYREKLAYGLLREMFNEDGKELATGIVTTLFHEFQNQ